MTSLSTQVFWLDASERALKTAAQAALVLIVGNNVSIWSLDWGQVFSAVLMGALASLLTSIASSGAGGNSASLILDAGKPKEEIVEKFDD